MNYDGMVIEVAHAVSFLVPQLFEILKQILARWNLDLILVIPYVA